MTGMVRDGPTTQEVCTRGSRRPHRRDHRPTGPDRLSRGLGLAFLLSSALAAALRATTPFEHGWWLVAYLALVGGLAQLLLAPGRASVLSRVGSAYPPRVWLWCELVLWNVGALTVPIGVFADGASAVLAGSVILLTALVLYAAGLRRTARKARRPARGWERAYYVLIGFLVASVFVGTGLAEALPWQ